MKKYENMCDSAIMPSCSPNRQVGKEVAMMFHRLREPPQEGGHVLKSRTFSDREQYVDKTIEGRLSMLKELGNCCPGFFSEVHYDVPVYLCTDDFVERFIARLTEFIDSYDGPELPGITVAVYHTNSRTATLMNWSLRDLLVQGYGESRDRWAWFVTENAVTRFPEVMDQIHAAQANDTVTSITVPPNEFAALRNAMIGIPDASCMGVRLMPKMQFFHPVADLGPSPQDGSKLMCQYEKLDGSWEDRNRGGAEEGLRGRNGRVDQPDGSLAVILTELQKRMLAWNIQSLHGRMTEAVRNSIDVENWDQRSKVAESKPFRIYDNMVHVLGQSAASVMFQMMPMWVHPDYRHTVEIDGEVEELWHRTVELPKGRNFRVFEESMHVQAAG